MISRMHFSIILLLTLLGANMTFAKDMDSNRDARAIEVLKKMSAYSASLDQVIISSTTFTDARLVAGLMVTNSNDIQVVIDRPGSMHIENFDGVDKKEIYFHKGTISVFNTGNNFYAQAEIPGEIEAATDFAVEELDLEAPLLDLIYRDVSTHLISSEDTILYLSDKSQVAGVDCHHLVIRGPEVDLQLWVEEGDRPLLRKLIMTSKWESGSPRFVANLIWDISPEINPAEFIFKAPEGAIDIGFANQTRNP